MTWDDKVITCNLTICTLQFYLGYFFSQKKWIIGRISLCCDVFEFTHKGWKNQIRNSHLRISKPKTKLTFDIDSDPFFSHLSIVPDPRFANKSLSLWFGGFQIHSKCYNAVTTQRQLCVMHLASFSSFHFNRQKNVVRVPETCDALTLVQSVAFFSAESKLSDWKK